MLDVIDQAALVLEPLGFRVVGPFTGQTDLQTPVEEGHLSHPGLHHLIGELGGLLEDLGGGIEGDRGTGALGRLDLGQFGLGLAVGELLTPEGTFADHLDFEFGGQRIDHRDADAVEAAGHRVGAVAELAAGVQGGEHGREGREFGLGVLVDGNAPSVVLDRYPAVLAQRHIDAGAVAGHRLVDRVVHDLPDQVMEAPGTGAADVHGGPASDCFQPLENRDVLGLVRRVHALRLRHWSPSSAEIGGQATIRRISH